MRWCATSANAASTQLPCAPRTATKRQPEFMFAFSRLYEELDSTTSINLKLAALARYFKHAPAEDAAWGTYFLSGRRLKRIVGAATLRAWLLQETALPDWLLEETYSQVGDLAET